MGALPTCMSVQHMHAVCLRNPKESVRSPRLGVRDNCKLSYKAGNPLKKQQMFLTSKPSLQTYFPFLTGLNLIAVTAESIKSINSLAQ